MKLLKGENRNTNIGCLIIIITVVVVIAVFSNPEKKEISQFEIISQIKTGKSAKTYCIFTRVKDSLKIHNHAQNFQKETLHSVVIFYYNNRLDIPDFGDTGYIISQKDHENAHAIYQRYGNNPPKFIIK